MRRCVERDNMIKLRLKPAATLRELWVIRKTLRVFLVSMM
jgi:hypothetical protein